MKPNTMPSNPFNNKANRRVTTQPQPPAPIQPVFKVYDPRCEFEVPRFVDLTQEFFESYLFSLTSFLQRCQAVSNEPS